MAQASFNRLNKDLTSSEVGPKGQRKWLIGAGGSVYPAQPMGAAVEIDPRTVSVTPGSPTTALVRVRNTGTVVDQLRLEVLGDAGGWATVEPPTLSLFPVAEGSATITFDPPRSPRVAAGRIPFGLRVESQEDPAGSVVDEGVVDVAPFADVSAEVVPRSSRGSMGATHDVAVDNRGNVPLEATVTAVDPDRLLDFDIRPPTVRAAPGAATFAKVRVRPRKTFWLGPAVSRRFEIQVAVPDATPVTLDGSLLQGPILPAWTLRALAIGLVLLVGGVLAWQALVRPAIESTARAQAEEVLAAVGITPPPSGGPGGGGQTGSPTPSASTSASPDAGSSPGTSGAPSAPPSAGTVAGTDGRLLAGAAPLVPPAGATLFVTDLVFSNPSDTLIGEIRLARSGEPLLVLQLANFRDLDFHFVTPIVVTAAQDLALVCPTGCDGAALYYSGYLR
jgi:hypothetical protein